MDSEDRKAVILIDGKESNSENIELPYLAKKIEVKLAQDKDYWNKVTVEYPSELKKDNKEYLIKQGTTFSSFVKENDIKEITSKDVKYEFSGFYLDDKEIVSSSMMKELARFGGDVTPFVPNVVADALQEKYKDAPERTIKMDEEITDVKG